MARYVICFRKYTNRVDSFIYFFILNIHNTVMYSMWNYYYFFN